MATIRQIPSGYWQGIIRKKGFPDKSKTFPTKRDCETWATDTEALINRGVFNDLSEAESLTIADGLKRYLLEVTPRKKGAQTERYRIEAMMREPFSQKTLATFKSNDAAKIRDDGLKAGFAASTVIKRLSIISHLFETAQKDWGVNCHNPVKKINKPKVDNARERRLSDIELKYLIPALANTGAGERANEVVHDVVLFAIETAMRQSEILGLTWSNVDLTKRVALLKNTKNGKDRGVPLSSSAIKLLDGKCANVMKMRRGQVFKTTASAVKQCYARAVLRARKAYEADFDVSIRDCQTASNTFH